MAMALTYIRPLAHCFMTVPAMVQFVFAFGTDGLEFWKTKAHSTPVEVCMPKHRGRGCLGVFTYCWRPESKDL